MPKQEPIMALGQSDWTVRDHARARLNSVFSLLARKKVFPFLHLPPGTCPSMILYSQQRNAFHIST